MVSAGPHAPSPTVDCTHHPRYATESRMEAWVSNIEGNGADGAAQPLRPLMVDNILGKSISHLRYLNSLINSPKDTKNLKLYTGPKRKVLKQWHKFLTHWSRSDNKIIFKEWVLMKDGREQNANT